MTDHELKVIELDAGAYRDIPRQLRGLADEIERDEHTNLKFIIAVLVGPHAGFEVRGWGEYTVLEGIGALARAVARPGGE